MPTDRLPTFDTSMRYDVVVIGAGLGGLTTAAILSRLGRRVLVIERHHTAGGSATAFRRPGYVFDVGVHYIGDCGPGGSVARLLREAGVEQRFLPMDEDGYDTLCFPDGMRFAYPKGLARFEARLLETFPAEARGVRRWCAFLRQVWRLMNAGDRPWTRLLAPVRSRLAVHHLDSTLADVLDTCTANPRLRAVLCGPHLDHAVAPSRVAAVAHAGVVNHYLWAGAFYPEGGGQVISDRLVDVVESNGGHVLLQARADRILVEGGAAAGVVFCHTHRGECTVRAPVIVSNADLKLTYQRLLPAESVPAALCETIDSYEMAAGIAALYLGVTREALGPDSARNTNYWVFPSDDVEQDYAALRDGRFAAQPTVYLTLASTKDPAQKIAPDGVVNLQALALAPSAPEAWGASTPGGGYDRFAPAYLARKQELADRLLKAAEVVFPGIRAGIVYQEMATPLTHARFTSATDGSPYGIAATPAQFGASRPGTTTHVPGLLLAGANTRSAHGVLGALQSGQRAAREAERCLRRRRGRVFS
jgi:phytoene dehydrogenase-like protein